MPMWKASTPKDDSEYLERLSKTIFTAGLNWKTIENKWTGFNKAFQSFVPSKVAKFSEREVKTLMKDEAIVRNEKKIRATIHNAEQFLELKNEFGSFQGYLDSFKKDEARLQDDLQERFQHVGPSTARMFLWSVAYPLAPNVSEKKWMSSHHGQA